jgi:sigma-B regulation protein RsbU (phosphoserine phosphatase)
MEAQAERVLIVGIDKSGQQNLAGQMEALGYQTIFAENGRKALDILAKQPFTLVLLSIELWGVSSYQVLERMRTSNMLATTPVLMLAPTDGAPGIDRCLELGASDYIAEPYQQPILHARVRACHMQREWAIHQQDDLRREELLKLERDVQIAQQIQEGFLPATLPKPSGWEIEATFHPARDVAGDFYDAFMLTQNRRLGFVVADVCDKGVGAALFMSLSRSLIRAFAQQNNSFSRSWAEILSDTGSKQRGRSIDIQGSLAIGATALKTAISSTNDYITDNHLDMNMFVTLFFGVLDPATGALIYVNGGHVPPAIVLPTGGIRATLPTTGPAVGMMPGANFEIGQAQLEPGEALFCYTDGVTDARSPTLEFFGDTGVQALLEKPVESADRLLRRFEMNLQAHIAGAAQFDDITMMALRRVPHSESE